MPGSSSLSVTIASGQALSTPADLTKGGTLTMILVPADWTNAHLGFQISADGQRFCDLVDENGADVAMTVVAGGAIPVPASAAMSTWLKVRSGPRASPVKQAADRVFNLIVC